MSLDCHAFYSNSMFPIPRPGRHDWLQWRRGGLGASDVAAVLGISPWASPYTVWLDKTGQRADEDSEAMEAGRMLEPAIGPWFEQRTGLVVMGEQMWCTHPDHPWARATLDGIVAESAESTFADALGGLEIKTTSEPPAKWEEGGIPPMYQAQGQFQMFVTGMEHTWFAVLHANFGLKLRIYELDRDDADIALLLERCEKFWTEHVLAGVPPPVDGHDATTEALKGTAADPDADAVDLNASHDAIGALIALPGIKAAIAAFERERAECENRIRAALGSATAGSSDFDAVTWKPQNATRIDTAALRERMPRVAARFSTTTTTRVLRITPKKEPAS